MNPLKDHTLESKVKEMPDEMDKYLKKAEEKTWYRKTALLHQVAMRSYGVGFSEDWKINLRTALEKRQKAEFTERMAHYQFLNLLIRKSSDPYK